MNHPNDNTGNAGQSAFRIGPKHKGLFIIVCAAIVAGALYLYFHDIGDRKFQQVQKQALEMRRAGQFPQAQRLYESLLENANIDPEKSTHIKNALGFLFVEAKQYKKGVIQFNDVLTDNGVGPSEKINAQIGLCDIAIAVGEFGECEKKLEAIIAKNPASPRIIEAYQRLARIAELKNETQKAKEIYGKRILENALDENAAMEARFALVDLYVRLGETDQAVETLTRMADRAPSEKTKIKTLVELTKVWSLAGNANEVEAARKRLGTVFPKAEDALSESEFWLGKVLTSDKIRQKEGWDRLFALTGDQPETPQAVWAGIVLARHFTQAGQSKKAVALLTTLRDRNEDHLRLSARICIEIAKCLLYRGEVEKAMEQINSAVSKTTEDAPLFDSMILVSRFCVGKIPQNRIDSFYDQLQEKFSAAPQIIAAVNAIKNGDTLLPVKLIGRPWVREMDAVNVYALQGDYLSAEKALDQMIRAQWPLYAQWAEISLLKILCAQGADEKAESQFMKISRMYQDLPEALSEPRMVWAKYLESTRQTDRAEDVLHDVNFQSMLPLTKTDAALAHARLCLDAKRFSQAADLFEKAGATCEGKERCLDADLGWVMANARAGQTILAKERLARIKDQNEESQKILETEIVFYRALAKETPDDAIKNLESFLQIDSVRYLAGKALVEIVVEKSRFDEGEKTCLYLETQYAADPHLLSAIQFLRADIYEKSGKLKKAQLLFESCAQNMGDPSKKAVALYRAYSLAEGGNDGGDATRIIGKLSGYGKTESPSKGAWLIATGRKAFFAKRFDHATLLFNEALTLAAPKALKKAALESLAQLYEGTGQKQQLEIVGVELEKNYGALSVTE